MKHAVILANGDFPSHPYPLDVLQSASFRVCCDGATEALITAQLEPHIIIGDLDSIPNAIREKYADRLIYDPDQEINDLTKAVNMCRKRGFKSLTILGATGKREDHTLGNIGLLARYAREGDIDMVTDHGVFVVIHNNGTLATSPGQQLSFFTVTKGVPVTISNVKYPVDNLLLDEIWQGTLNEATSDSITITAPNATLIVFLLYPDENQVTNAKP